MPVDGQELKCQYCPRTFLANRDRLAARYEWFLDDLKTLRETKRYGLFILALCQACEIFMDQAIINQLIDKNPKYRNGEGCFSEEYNRIREEFNEKKCGDISRELNVVCNHKQHKLCSSGNLTQHLRDIITAGRRYGKEKKKAIPTFISS